MNLDKMFTQSEPANPFFTKFQPEDEPLNYTQLRQSGAGSIVESLEFSAVDVIPSAKGMVEAGEYISPSAKIFQRPAGLDEITGQPEISEPDITIPQLPSSFDAEYYAKMYPDLVEAGLTTPQQLYEHFQEFGMQENRCSSPLIDLNFYRWMNSDLAEVGVRTNEQLYEHLLNHGIKEGRSFSPLVDLKHYLANNPDLQEAFGDDLKLAFEHLQKYGLSEGRDISPWVDLKYYLANNTDLQEAFGEDYKQVFEHLQTHGLNEGRKFGSKVDVDFYLADNTDVVEEFGSDKRLAFQHWLKHGIFEGRKCFPDVDIEEGNWSVDPTLINIDPAFISSPETVWNVMPNMVSESPLPVPISIHEVNQGEVLESSTSAPIVAETPASPVPLNEPISGNIEIPKIEPIEETPALIEQTPAPIPELVESSSTKETLNPIPELVEPASIQKTPGPISEIPKPTPIENITPISIDPPTIDLTGIDEGNAPVPVTENSTGEKLNPTLISLKTLTGFEPEPTPPINFPEKAGGPTSDKPSSPKHLQFDTTKEEYYNGETVRLKDAWVFDSNSAGDLDRVEFTLHRGGEKCEEVENATIFKAYSGDVRWGWFNYALSGLTPGDYKITGTAFDSKGRQSNVAVTKFTVNTETLPTPLIGFIDTGFARNNPDIDYSRILLGKDRIDGDNDPLMDSGEGSDHGTHVLGIVAAIQDNGTGIYGMNNDATIWLGRAIGSGQWAESLIEFVDTAKASGKSNAIINLSLDLTQEKDGVVTTRYEFTPREREALEYARQNGVLIVAAAGNDGGVMSVLGQASQEFDNIITVGSADGINRANYSSYGYGLDIMAEGGTTENQVLSTVGDFVGRMAGTSVATAQVAGAASLVWEANPDLSFRQVIDVLKSNASDLNVAGWDKETGAGFLNVEKAVEAAKITVPVAYIPEAFNTPETWGGEGLVVPGERAAADEFNGKWYEWEPYTLVDGDTLSQIALDTMGDASPAAYNFIAQHNRIPDPDIIFAGATIQIPYEVGAPISTPSPTPPPTSSIIINGFTIGGNFYPVYQNYQLGNPLSNEIPYSAGVSYQLFQNGSIVSSPNGTFPLYGGIRQTYLSTGGLNGWLGAPTSAETGLGNGVIQQTFQNGYIIWNGSSATAYQNGSGNSTPGVSIPTTPSSVLTQQDFNNWQSWPEYTSRNPFPSKGQNCTWYAHGRMMQLGYSEFALDSMLQNAGTWDNQAGRGATVTSNPQAPCIAVWEAGVGGAGSVGHVAVVERVNADGSILISESNWANTTYNTRTISRNSFQWPSSFVIVPRA